MTEEYKEENEAPENHDEFEEEFDFEEGSEYGEESSQEEDILAAGPEEEASDEMPTPAPRKSGMGIPLIIGLAVIGFIGWKIYGKFSGPKQPASALEQASNLPTATPAKTQALPPATESEETASPPPTAEPEAQPPVAKQPDPALAEASKAPDQPALPQEVSPIEMAPSPQAEIFGQQAPIAEPKSAPAAATELSEESLSRIQKKINEQEEITRQQITNLEKDLQMAAQNSANTTKNMSALQQELSTLSNVIQELAREVKAIREEQERLATRQVQKSHSAPKPRAVERAEPNPSLTIHAIIPGRAWLRGQDGKIQTVSEGDAVGQYGKVLKIDAANGIVVTSSGVTLR